MILCDDGQILDITLALKHSVVVFHQWRGMPQDAFELSEQ